LIGVVVGSIIAALLDVVIASLSPLSNAIGAIVAGVIAAYVLNGKPPQAFRTGVVSGVLGLPFYFGVAQILYIFGAYPIQTTTPTWSQLQVLQESVVIIFVIYVGLGSGAGFMVGAVRHPPTEIQPPQPIGLGSSTGQPRYCVQCGAQLPAGTLICPHCNARQPS